MKNYLATLFFVLSLSGLSFAQEGAPLPCATPDYHSDWLTSFQQNPEIYQRSVQEAIYAPLTIHLVADDNGLGYLSIHRLLDALCILNQDFEDSGIQFFIKGDIRYINNSRYFRHDFGGGYQMMVQNNVPNTINCYVVGDPAGACGYYTFGADAIALSKGCLNPPSHTWAHEVGHLLSLPHTFSGWEGRDYETNENTPVFVGSRAVERVDGSNCQNAGDGFCDTPPDYLSYRWACSGNFESSVLQRDPVGEPFRSDGTFFMSYANDNCSNRFSQGQSNAMVANLQQQRPNTISDQPPQPPTAAPELSVLSPQAGATVGNSSTIELSWEAIDGATGYVVEVSVLSNFQIALHQQVAFGTFASVPASKLIDGLEHYWRIRPFNPYYFCSEYSNSSTFVFGTSVSSRLVTEPVQGLKLMPNPVSGGQELTASFYSSRPQRLELALLSLAGQPLQRQVIEGATGWNRFSLPARELPSGIYLARISGADGRSAYRKIVVR